MKKILLAITLILCISLVFSSCSRRANTEKFMDEFNQKFDKKFDEMEDKFEKKFNEKFNEENSKNEDESTGERSKSEGEVKEYIPNSDKKGNLIEYKVDDFKTLYIKTPPSKTINLVYSSTVTDIIKIDASDTALSKVKIYEENGKLFVDFKTNFENKDRIYYRNITIYISPLSLERIEVEGALDFDNSDTLKMPTLKLDIAGALDADLNLDVTNLEIDVAGALDADLKGKVDSVKYNVAGAADITALELITKNTKISVAGAVDISCNASDNLIIEVFGAGDVKYRGNPQITADFPMLVDIKKVD